jgi:mRNA interferase YafQ
MHVMLTTCSNSWEFDAATRLFWPVQARCEAGAETRQGHMNKLKALLSLLIDGVPLPASCLDHPLKGGWIGFRDTHIEPDWLLIYKIAGDVVRFERIGRHADLFDG